MKRSYFSSMLILVLLYELFYYRSKGSFKHSISLDSKGIYIYIYLDITTMG